MVCIIIVIIIIISWFSTNCEVSESLLSPTVSLPCLFIRFYSIYSSFIMSSYYYYFYYFYYMLFSYNITVCTSLIMSFSLIIINFLINVIKHLQLLPFTSLFYAFNNNKLYYFRLIIPGSHILSNFI